jgi:hypothetical protein
LALRDSINIIYTTLAMNTRSVIGKEIWGDISLYYLPGKAN